MNSFPSKIRSLLVCFLAGLATSGIGRSAEPPEPAIAERDFFEKKIRPVLVQHCYQCHSADAAEVGANLLLDTAEGLRAGGESGTPVIAGKPAESLLIKALRYDGTEMPPDQPLPPAVVNDFVQWVQRGAADPRVAAVPESTPVEPAAPHLWSLQKPLPSKVPAVNDRAWPRQPLDHFVLHNLEQRGLRPTGDTTPEVLLRRLWFDLIGLPPSAEDVERFVVEFVQDDRAAVERAVDELLAKPQFGERWGRHWLDVARYGESNGNDGLGRNPTFPHAWRYRDYVIDAFNRDMPYDQFLAEQIAGDLMTTDDAAIRDRRLVATGFLAMAAKPAKAMNTNFEMDVVADQIEVVGTGIMGLSVACARCHDHKFDPVTTRDYYALAGIFTSTETMWGLAANEKLTAPSTDLHVLKATPHAPPPADFVETVLVLESNTGKPKPIPQPKWPVGTPLAMGARDRAKPTDCKVNVNGDAKKLGAEVPRGELSAFALPLEVNPQQSGRLELAQWLGSPDHPLTARVMVNRIWLHMFGQGIVATPNDFGVYGSRPTHPELLDYLATQFVDRGWSVKELIRNIALSRTYRLSSLADKDLLAADPENIYYTRHLRRRMDAESIRDKILSASGQLDLQPADGSLIRHRDILVNLAGNLHQPSRHRSVYLCYLRSSPPPELAAFNLPDFTAPVGQRDCSTLPDQALHLLNNPFVVEQAFAFASLVLEATDNDDDRIHLTFRRALSRSPRDDEALAAKQLLDSAAADAESEQQTWANLTQALMLTNEFRYID